MLAAFLALSKLVSCCEEDQVRALCPAIFDNAEKRELAQSPDSRAQTLKVITASIQRVVTLSILIYGRVLEFYLVYLTLSHFHNSSSNGLSKASVSDGYIRLL